jgi:transposase
MSLGIHSEVDEQRSEVDLLWEIAQHRRSGTLGPKIRTEQTPIKLNPEQLEVLRQLLEEQPDATLGELQERLHEKKTDVSIGSSTIDRGNRFC